MKQFDDDFFKHDYERISKLIIVILWIMLIAFIAIALKHC